MILLWVNRYVWAMMLPRPFLAAFSAAMERSQLRMREKIWVEDLGFWLLLHVAS